MAESRAKKWWECFIATAAFGDPLTRELEVLRRFRDTVLLRGRVGSGVVSAYYRLSPAIAELIKDSQRMRRFARSLLRPVLKVCKVLMCGKAYCLKCAEKDPTIKELGVCPDCEEVFEAEEDYRGGDGEEW